MWLPYAMKHACGMAEAGRVEGEEIKVPISLIQGIAYHVFSKSLKLYVLFRPLYYKSYY